MRRQLSSIAVSVAFLISLAAAASADTIYVNGTTGNNAWDGRCEVWDGGTCGPKKTIQAGIDVASNGDEVVVADGTYSGAGNKVLALGVETITIRSANGPKACVIDCEGNGNAFTIVTPVSPISVIDGFTMINGFAEFGGAVRCQFPMTVRNCVMRDNEATWGGAVYGAANVENCTIANNTAAEDGGGIRGWSDLTIRNCTIVNNMAAENAGGVSCGSDVTIWNCTITDNTAGRHGGGVKSGGGASVIVSCVVERNRAIIGLGGGIHGSDRFPTISDCRIVDNSAFRGGGLSNCDGIIEDCTIADNSAEDGGGLYDCDGEIDRCLIRRNWADEEGGGLAECGATLTATRILENTADVGGGVRCFDRELILLNCEVSRNDARFDGGGIWTAKCNVDLFNCTIENNTAFRDGGGAFLERSERARLRRNRVFNCTVRFNSAGQRAGGIMFHGVTGFVTNCIAWSNDAPAGSQFTLDSSPGGGPADLTVSHSDVQDGETAIQVQGGSSLTWGPGNIDIDPQTAFASNAHILTDSPVIDAGTNDVLPLIPATDPDGNARSLDGDGDGNAIADMGAYEYNPSAPSIAADTIEFTFRARLTGPNPPDQMLSLRNTGGVVLDWQVQNKCPWLEVVPESGSSSGEIDQVVFRVDVAGLPRGYRECELLLNGDGAVNSPLRIRVTFGVTTTLRVPSEYATIQAAIDDAVDGDEILLADNVYRGPGNRGLRIVKKQITIRSANGPQTCVIDAEQADRVLTLERGGAVIEGVTFTNGSAVNGAAIACEHSDLTLKRCNLTFNSTNCGHSLCGGGAIDSVFSDLVIEHCEFTGNNAAGSSGGALNIQRGSLIMTDTDLVDNTTPSNGGGVNLDVVRVSIRGCTLTDNSGGDGGALAISSPVAGGEVVDCDFSGNSAHFDGGAIEVVGSDADWLISRCSFIMNTARRGAGVYCSVAEGQVRNCVFDANVADGGIGGGLFIRGGSSLQICGSRFTGNMSSGSGAGAYIERSGPILFEDCLFDLNTAVSPGAAVYTDDSATTLLRCEVSGSSDRQGAVRGEGDFDTPVLIGCFIHDNEAGGVRFEGGSNPVIEDCLIINNPGLGVYVGPFTDVTVINNTTIAANAPTFPEPGGGITDFSQGVLHLTNSIVWDNTPGLPDIRIGVSVTANVAYTLVEDGQAGVENLGGTLNWLDGNIDADPRFVDLEGGDAHLLPDSPCIDTGDPALVANPGRTDVDQQMRVWDGDGDGDSRVDMGADEFGSFVFGDLNCDDATNAFDIEPFILALFDPAEYELRFPDCDAALADLNADGQVDAFDIEAFLDLLFP